MRSTKSGFLHRLNAYQGQGLYVSTSATRLRNEPFLDGRVEFWDSSWSMPLPPAYPVSGIRRPKYVFHVSFCGSTLLASLLDTPGSILVLKEPQALVDLSEQVSTRSEISALLPLVEDGLQGSIEGKEATVIKPSNWANKLIPSLCPADADTLAVFISMPRYDFIRAVMRGGRERMAYTARATAHMTSASEALREQLGEAISGAADPIEQVARMAGLLHRHQESLFLDAMSSNNWGNRHWINFEDIVSKPVATVVGALETLDLELDHEQVESRVRLRSLSHSKQANMPFSTEHRAFENRETERHFGAIIRRASEWADRLAMV